MFKSILIAAAILLPSGLFASNQTLTDNLDRETRREMCHIIGPDYHKCLRADRYCFWDEEDGRCEPLRATGRCGRLNFQACNHHPDCFWDDEDGRCEQL